MPRRFVLGLALVFAIATMSSPREASAAQGVYLSWNHCFGDAGAAQNAVFACDTNSGSHTITGSFRLDAPFPLVIGEEIVLDLASASQALPAWWMFKNTGTCRQASLSVNVSFDPADVVCADWADGLEVGGLGGYCTAFNAMPLGCGLPGQLQNTARIKIVEAVAPDAAADLLGNQHYFTFHIVIDHAKTVGTGSCAGCDVPVCIVLNSINVVGQYSYEQRFLSTPAAPGSNFITWQGGGLPVVGGISGCPAATPTRRSTWGGVKTLYR